MSEIEILKQFKNTLISFLDELIPFFEFQLNKTSQLSVCLERLQIRQKEDVNFRFFCMEKVEVYLTT